MLIQTPNRRRQLHRLAFTLMEMMIVVAIIVALAGIGILSYGTLMDKGPATKAMADIKNLTAGVVLYKAAHQSQYPESLQKLLERDEGGGPYIQNAESLIDPWDRPYQYDPSGTNNNGTQPDIWCDMPNNLGKACNWTRRVIPN